MLKILIVEDDLAWVTIIKNILETDNDFVIEAVASTREDALKIAKSMDLDLIIMDINLHGNKRDGILAACEISEICKAKIIMLTSLNENQIIVDSFCAGAINFIFKDNLCELPRTIKMATNDNSPYKILLQEFKRLKEEEQMQDLSKAEKNILTLIENGTPRKNLEAELFVSESTIKKHVSNILKKLNVSSIRQAIQKIRRKGLY